MSFTKNLKNIANEIWEDCYNHPFVQELGKGTLDKERFKFYLIQDYKYLYEYAKVFALATLKSFEPKIMINFTTAQHSILVNEMSLHRAYMESFGINLTEAENTKTSLFNKAYTSNMLSVAESGDITHIIATVLPCAWSYGDYGKRLKSDYNTILENNPYKDWINCYSSEDYNTSFDWMFSYLDNLVENKSQKEKAYITEIFIDSIKFEYLFWDMAYNKELSYRK